MKFPKTARFFLTVPSVFVPMASAQIKRLDACAR